MLTTINSKDIKNIPEEFQEEVSKLTIIKVSEEGSMENVLLLNLIDIAEEPLGADIIRVSYQDKDDCTLLITHSVEETNAILLPNPVKDVLKFFEELEAKAYERERLHGNI